MSIRYVSGPLAPHERWRLRTRRRPGCRLRASPSCGLLAAKDHASRSRFRDQSALLVAYGALYIADYATPPHDYSFRSELCLPDRAEEIDFQFNRSEGFLRSENTCKRQAHRGISNVAQNPPMQRSHGICMLWSGRQDDRRPSVSNVFRFKSNQTRDWNVVGFCSFPKIRLQANFLSTHDLSAPAFDFRARTLVSR